MGENMEDIHVVEKVLHFLINHKIYFVVCATEEWKVIKSMTTYQLLGYWVHFKHIRNQKKKCLAFGASP